jgi:hypothetical protein
VLVSPYTDDIKFKVGIVNDRLEQVNAQLILKMMDFDGRVFGKGLRLWRFLPIPAGITSTKTQ